VNPSGGTVFQYRFNIRQRNIDTAVQRKQMFFRKHKISVHCCQRKFVAADNRQSIRLRTCKIAFIEINTGQQAFYSPTGKAGSCHVSIAQQGLCIFKISNAGIDNGTCS
jgi:hypothetical protein